MPPGFSPGGPAPPFPPAGALPPFPPPPFVPGASATPPIPPLPPRGLPPPQFVPAQQQPTPTPTPQPPVAPPPGGPLAPSAGGPHPSAGGFTSSESQGPTAEVRPADPRQGPSQLTHPPRQLTLPNPALAQVNPEFKKPTVLKWLDPNFSPVSYCFGFVACPPAASSEDWPYLFCRRNNAQSTLRTSTSSPSAVPKSRRVRVWRGPELRISCRSLHVWVRSLATLKVCFFLAFKDYYRAYRCLGLMKTALR